MDEQEIPAEVIESIMSSDQGAQERQEEKGIPTVSLPNGYTVYVYRIAPVEGVDENDPNIPEEERFTLTKNEHEAYGISVDDMGTLTLRTDNPYGPDKVYDSVLRYPAGTWDIVHADGELSDEDIFDTKWATKYDEEPYWFDISFPYPTPEVSFTILDTEFSITQSQFSQHDNGNVNIVEVVGYGYEDELNRPGGPRPNVPVIANVLFVNKNIAAYLQQRNGYF